MMTILLSRISAVLSILLFVQVGTYANNLQISNVTYDETNFTLNFDISWDNAFYVNPYLADHIYIHVKYKNANGSSWESAWFEATGHSNDNPLLVVSVAGDGASVDDTFLGLRIYHHYNFTSGTQSANCTAQLANIASFFHPSFKVFGIEMTSITILGGNYYLGDGTSQYRWHRGNDTTKAFFWDLGATGSINVGNGPTEINTTHPDGIPVSSISADKFKTTSNIMKYEISQLQYVEFLNCLNRTAQNNRVGTDVSGTSITDVFVMTETPTVATFTRNGIRCDATLPNGGPITFYCDYNDNGVPNEYDDGQNIAMNYLSGEDLFAYLDWAGLRPLNEIEYEAICRGTYNPVPNEFAWGTSGYTNAQVNLGSTYGSSEEYLNNSPLTGPMRSSQSPMRSGAAATATTNRVTSGASAYGIMELSGNVAELVIALRSANSFNNTLNDPDGAIDNFGNANTNWVKEITHKGFFQNTPGGANSVSHRALNIVPFTARSAFYGGRGGY